MASRDSRATLIVPQISQIFVFALSPVANRREPIGDHYIVMVSSAAILYRCVQASCALETTFEYAVVALFAGGLSSH